MIENGLDRLHRPASLVFDAIGMIMFGDDMRVFVIERRWRRTRNKQQPAWTFDPHCRRVRHIDAAFRLGLNFLKVWIGRRSLKSGLSGHANSFKLISGLRRHRSR